LAHAASFGALACEALIIIALSVASGVLFQLAAHDQLGDIVQFNSTGIAIALIYCGIVRFRTPRSARASATRLGRARSSVLAWTATFLFLIVLGFSLKVGDRFSRGAIFSLFTLGLLVLPWSRAMIPRIFSKWQSNSAYEGLEVLLVAPFGYSPAKSLLEELSRRGCSHVRVINFDDTRQQAAWTLERRRLLREVFDVAKTALPGEVYVLTGALSTEVSLELMSGLRILPRAVYLVPREEQTRLLQYSVHGVGPFATLELQRAPMTRTERRIKRAMDLAIASLAIILLSPALAVIAAAIKVDSKGPIFFRQNRLGYRGRPFRILKFRSMTVMEDGDTLRQAERNDQRVTRVGYWLRRTSLDEVPQLWNVLLGEMSIVGPRPHAAAHDATFSKLIENYEVRQHVKPGITGWAQVHGLRGETSEIELMYRRIEFDIWYACNSTLSLDVQILFKTIGAVLSQQNAF
jgi:undecaprenyl-phosphate galactose phosphotransferase/putative colanic acid biosynthesis UDP-glucose lipid carrier transferase